MYVCGYLVTVSCVAVSYRRGNVFMVVHHMYPMLNPLAAGFSRKCECPVGGSRRLDGGRRGYFSRGHELVCC